MENREESVSKNERYLDAPKGGLQKKALSISTFLWVCERLVKKENDENICVLNVKEMSTVFLCVQNHLWENIKLPSNRWGRCANVK